MKLWSKTHTAHEVEECLSHLAISERAYSLQLLLDTPEGLIQYFQHDHMLLLGLTLTQGCCHRGAWL